MRGHEADGRHRILFISHTAEWVGPNVSLLELATHLPERFESEVVFPGDGRFRPELEKHGIAHSSVRRLDKFGIPGLVWRIGRQRVDLVYGNSASGVSKNALIAAKLCGVPFVYHLREMAGSARWRKVGFLGLADATIAVSNATAASYAPYVRNPPTVVYNGVRLEAFDRPRERCRQRLIAEFGFPETASVVIHVGNVYPRKDQLSAVEVLRRVAEARPLVRLVLVGHLDRDPAYVERLRQHVRSAGLEKRVVIAGFRTDLPDLLAGSDVYLHTAREDPHPRAVIEAMAAGLPVVAVRVDGVAETVLDGRTGYLVAPDDPDGLSGAVSRLLFDPGLRNRLGGAGRERARQLFDARSTAQQVAKVLDAVLGRRD